MDTTPQTEMPQAEPTQPEINQTVTPRKSSLLKIIIIVLVVAGLGVGGYFAYAKYIAPMLNPYNKIIPAGLEQYAKGQDADAFVIVHVDDAILQEITKIQPQNPFGDMTGAIVLINGQKQSVAVAMNFKSKAGADSVKTLIEAQKTSDPTMPAYTIEEKDNVLLVSVEEGFNAFTGNLVDNPNIKNVDLKKADNQIIVFMDNSKLMASMELSSALINTLQLQPITGSILTAHAQAGTAEGETPAFSVKNLITDGTIPQPSQEELDKTAALQAAPMFLKNTVIYIGLKNGVISVSGNMTLMDKSEIPSSALFSAMQKISATTGSQQIIGSMEKTYDSMLVNIPKVIADAQKSLLAVKLFVPDLSVSLNYKDKTFTVSASIKLETLESAMMPYALGAPAKGRNAARKADINSIVSALESYNLEKNGYPVTSGCVDKMTELEQYLPNKTAPKDTSGAQTIGNTTCDGGYYYQSFGDKGYILWAKMEENAGNTLKTPDEVSALVQSGQAIPVETGGTYFIFNRVNITATSANNGIIETTQIANSDIAETGTESQITDTQSTSTQITEETIFSAPKRVKRTTAPTAETATTETTTTEAATSETTP